MATGKIKVTTENIFPIIKKFLYSDHEIFLRELVSNAVDATSKLKALSSLGEVKGDVGAPLVEVKVDKKAKTITISDNGIGMNKEDLIENLGTIARSGTKKFIENLSGDSKKDSNLIGQFGVGFYSCFMVSDKVEVTTKKAGEKTAYLWKSDGQTGFSISEIEQDGCGTTIKLFLNEEGAEYTNKWSIETIVKKYSDHIAFPIYLHYTEKKDEKKENIIDQVNSASAFWKRSKSSLKKKDYHEFYKTFANEKYGDDYRLGHSQTTLLQKHLNRHGRHGLQSHAYVLEYPVGQSV